jgi:2-polyprenyl-3-methyl-5-hydroxy-6-metoxy-1,4-benzoquinol methylase
MMKASDTRQAERRGRRPCNLCDATRAREIFVKNGFSLVQCRSCGLVYVDDPPAADELRRLYSFDAGYHTTCVGDKSADTALHRRSAREYYDLLSRYKSGGSLLDVGCSTGFFLRVARDQGWETCGLEISPDTASLARDRYGLDVLTGTLEETTFPANRFDAVTLWDVIEHVQDPVTTMSIVHRILKDDGLVAFLTPNVGGLFPRAAYAAARIIDYWPHPEPPHHLFQFSKTTARRLVTRTGFTVRQVVDKRIPLAYTFGGLKGLLRSPRQLAYATCFAPIAALGPLVGAGDSMIVIAQKPPAK